ncbi:hypothetical protein Tco_1036083, partial [Tanacetum coccineum]
APTPRLGKRLGSPPSIVVVSASEPSHVGTLAPTSTSGRSVVASGRVGKSEAEVMRRQMDLLDCLARSALARDAEYDQIPNDDFGTATRGEEIDLTLFPLAPDGIQKQLQRGICRNYKKFSQDIRDQLNAEAEAVQIILTGIDNDIYSTVDACPNACEMWKAIERLKQVSPPESQQSNKTEEKSIVTPLLLLLYDPEPATVTEVGGKYSGVAKSRIQCYQLQGIWHVSRECQNQNEKDAAYHKEKNYCVNKRKLGIRVTPDSVDNSGPIFDDEPMHKVQNNNDNYNVFSMESEHPEQPESSNHIYLAEQGVIPNTSVSRPQLKSNQLEDRVMSNNSQGKKQEVEDHRVNSRTRQPMAVPVSTREPKNNVNQSVATFNKKTVATDSTLVEIILFIVDSGCSKHMTGNLKLLTNFVEKFLGTVKFGNDQIVHQFLAMEIDGENLDKMKEKGDACIFVGYSTQSKAYRVFNKRTRMIVETIHVNFDELPQMVSDHVSSDPDP